MTEFIWFLTSLCSLDDPDSDSDAYCDPETIPDPPRLLHPPAAPQKSLPPPPCCNGGDSEDSDDSGHDYEDPPENIRPSARVVSLRRSSQPVLNPDAYLALDEMEVSSSYQDVCQVCLFIFLFK